MIALTHVPSPNLDQGQRTYVGRVPIDLALAGRQHEAYCRMLRDCGAAVRTLEQDLVRLCDDIGARLERLQKKGSR